MSPSRARWFALIFVGIVACGTNGHSSDPLPIYTTIVDGQCLAAGALDAGANAAACILLATLPTPGPESDCTKYQGLTVPDSLLLQQFQQSEVDQAGGDAGALLELPACVVSQLSLPAGGSCKASTSVGWCQVQNTSMSQATRACAQAVVLTAGLSQQIKGATYVLRCGAIP